MAATAKAKRIDPEIINILSQQIECDGSGCKITGDRLDPKTYKKVNEVLEALGGKWNRTAQSHLFDGSAEAAIESAILTGTFNKPGDFGFFETPDTVIERLLELADVRAGMSCLEPSAGRGAIASRLAEIVDQERIACVELQPANCRILEKSFDSVIEADFLSHPEDYYIDVVPGPDGDGIELPGRFDRVVMNPPFAPNQADIDHVWHAFKFLKPGGRLISVMSSSFTFRTNRKSAAFREWMLSVEGDYEYLPEGSFRSSGTDVNTVIVTADKRA